MKAERILSLAFASMFLITAGCHKTNAVDKGAFKSAINNYLGAHQECVWATTQKFPTQADTNNDDQTKGFDALTDAGLLTRRAAEKKRFLIGSKEVNMYDLSDKGRSTWTADQTQPGYGNFCFGHREVTSIDTFSPPDTAEATQYTVNYHYDVAGVPAWAATNESKTAFPKIATDISGQQTATASLIKSSDGWQVSSIQPSTANPPLPQ